MSVRIQIVRPFAHFTNLDHISGNVILNITTDESVSAIIVKLEGESRTRLAGPRSAVNDRPDRNKTEIEVHKLLYKVTTVFPNPEIQKQVSGNPSYTLSSGQYEYPFQFKLPFNNHCSNNNSMFTNLNMAGLRMEMARDTCRHVKKTLPPSLNGFPGAAEIRYFVKVTVVRPQIWRENRRAFADFKFLPIEPPRPLNTGQESYARRQHQFTKGLAAAPQRRSLFDSFKTPAPEAPAGDEEPLRFSVDSRLPSPAIITCNEPLPLRILVKRLNEGPGMIFLQTIQIDLIGYTKIRAHELTRTETGSWIITSASNMKLPLGTLVEGTTNEFEVDSKLWNRVPLPNTVAPSFDTCNLSRTYELEVKLGLAHGTPGKIKNSITPDFRDRLSTVMACYSSVAPNETDTIIHETQQLTAPKPELILLPLRMPVQIFSGIAPPKALLTAMAASRRPTSFNASATPNVRPPSFIHNTPPTPTTPTYSSVPPQQGQYGVPMSVNDDAPPSYEDAIAEDIGPVDGPRRDYSQPDHPSGAARLSDDWKSSGERLFPETESRGHPRGGG